MAAAIGSSLRQRTIPGDWLILGVVGLTGELRAVPRLEARLAEGQRHGFRRALIPRQAASWKAPDGMDCRPCSNLEDAIGELLRDR